MKDISRGNDDVESLTERTQNQAPVSSFRYLTVQRGATSALDSVRWHAVIVR